MKCPKCSKEISDESFFCGYCGQAINEEIVKDIPDAVVVPARTQKKVNAVENICYTTKIETSAKKPGKRIGLKIVLTFSIIAIIAGTVFGWLTAKGIVDLLGIIPRDHFEWTDFSEGFTDDESEEVMSDEKSVDKNSENSSTSSTTTDETNSNDDKNLT